MGNIYGYARCSTNETRQDIDRQKRELYAMGVPDEQHIYCEYESGLKKDREALSRLLDTVVQGDTIAVTEVSRLSRSTQHLCEIIELVQKKKLRLLIGAFDVDCRFEVINPMTKGMLMMWAVFAEMERDIISERVRSGMRNAAAKGKQIGRPVLDVDSLPRDFWKAWKLYKRGDLTVSDMAKMLNVSRTTVYKYIRCAEESKSETAKDEKK